MNNRLFWAVEAVGLAPLGSTNFVPVHGVQSLGLDLNFSLEDILELGQAEVYEIKEDVPEVEVTLEKVLDGYPIIYHLATQGTADTSLLGRQNQRCMLALSAFGDTQSSASGVPIKEIQCSGLYYSSVSYDFSADGNFTESVTLVGNNLKVKNSNFDFAGSLFDNTDQPLALVSGLGGVQRRKEFLWGPNGSIIPTQIQGITASGTNELTNGQYGTHVSRISVSMDAGREGINELGRRSPYFRYAGIPIEVTTEIEVISTEMHDIEADEDADSNVINEKILIKIREGLTIDLGSRNKLQSVSKTGASTGGENESITYTYRNLNSFSVSHPQMPV